MDAAAPQKKKSRLRDYVIAAVIGLIVLVGVCVAGFWQKDLIANWQLRPWQRAEYQGLMDRMHRAAVDADWAALQNCVDPKLITVQHEAGTEPVLELGSMMRRTVPIQDISTRGPYRLKSITLQLSSNEPAAMAHALDNKDVPVVFLMKRSPEGRLQMAHVGLESMGMQP